MYATIKFERENGMLSHKKLKTSKDLKLNTAGATEYKRTKRQTAGGSKVTQSNVPPRRLLNTWYWMWKFGGDKKTTQKGKTNLLQVFKNTTDAEIYFSKF